MQPTPAFSRTDDADATLALRSRPRDTDPDIAAEEGEKPHEAVGRKPLEPAPEERRRLRLTDPQSLPGGRLGEPFALDDEENAGGEVGLGKRQTRIGNAEIGEHIPTAAFHAFGGHGLTPLRTARNPAPRSRDGG